MDQIFSQFVYQGPLDLCSRSQCVLDRRIPHTWADIINGRVIRGAKHVDGQAVDQALAVVGADLQLVRACAKGSGHNHNDLAI